MPPNESNYKWTGKEIERFPKKCWIIHSLRKCFISNWHTSENWQFLNSGEFQWVSQYPVVTETNQLSLIPVHASHSQLLQGVYGGFDGCKNSGCRDRNVNFEDETRLKQRVWLLWQFYPILCILSTGVFLVWIEGKWSLIAKLLLNTLCFYFVKTQT